MDDNVKDDTWTNDQRERDIETERDREVEIERGLESQKGRDREIEKYGKT